ncbi:hypothetical protein ACIQC9_02260 [Brevundimonas sp. NPDC092305]|uniref:hypothetical protein n=1 Tax=Brevundimonas sp. NPDC092305 TaxID=3363957 RepID=UPI003819757C
MADQRILRRRHGSNGRRASRYVSERIETVIVVGLALLVLVYGGSAMAQVLLGMGRMTLAVLRG